MILIDSREETTLQKQRNLDLIQHIRREGLAVETAVLPFSDAFMEGNGPDGRIGIGIERKRLHDMLTCVEDGRFNEQRIGMNQMCQVSILIVEGHWKPHEPNGILMEGFSGGYSWGFCKFRTRKTMYSELYRYLLSVSLSGVVVTYSRDPFHTAYNICEVYRYFDKKWDDHTSMREIKRIAIPTLNFKPPLVRKWAQDVEGIGVKFGEVAARIFRKPITLANADENDWLRIPGIGIKKARDIVREIWGIR